MNLKYIELDFENLIKKYNKLLINLSVKEDLESQIKIIKQINKIRDDFFSMFWLSYINYILDVNSEYWSKQEERFSKYNPIMDNLKLKYYQIILKSKFKEELKKVFGEKLFLIASSETVLLSDELLEDTKLEKELSNKYNKIASNIKVNYDGKDLSLSQLNKYLFSSDKKVRQESNSIRIKELEKVEESLDSVYADLVKIRNEIAKKLNFNSYTDLSYIKMGRFCYGKKEVEVFRENVIKYIVPLVLKIKDKQKKELGVKELMYYDDPILFKDGNAIPKGNTEFITKEVGNIYKNISPKLSYLFDEMIDENLVDLDSRLGKRGGGIATYIPKYKRPIFVSNFCGTTYDVAVLTHEFGHSFQLYSSRNLKIYENWWPTFDACEIHSISMELLMMKYTDKIFMEDNYKYIYEKLSNILANMCYICLVDEFQHIIYDNINLSKEERKHVWRSLEKKYMPWLIFDNRYLEEGNMWHKQLHIFTEPFYYIDYALANSIALQFYYLSLDNESLAWKKYIKFCSWGGKYTFIDSVLKIGFKSPFEEESFKAVVNKLESLLLK